ncbi:MAG: hydrogen peroxide-inducible genes activator [Saprospiraceae bacterium]|jgi:LysR family hydrogen peroxide-inducible transcriptional activator|nr:hydrogen peroxide-inducible genes activator [Saprospiraceae bacterium]MBP6234942.1 hydrogen peroxide-inducible genes activator [Saprospiraceae bacterium]MBP6565576.1 hydrogen peroxide-inducible genes activator [Saprospiraceae bacterium]MBP9196665.1 hydrogen peroxide-inducible genes activator [Saprospiraceae bacterium]
MNIQIAQLKYFLALVSTKNYTTAAEQCNVSQPALSMAIRKLEEELDLILIDRKSNPISLTEKGELIASQANKILEEIFIMGKLASELHLDKLNGSLKLSVIPTLAPYIIPLFIQKFTVQYPEVELIIEEETTKSIIQKLKASETDVGLLVTPLDEKSMVTHPVFYEEFFVFSHDKIDKTYILPEDIDFRHLWLLEEGHCMRHQMMKLCELRNLENSNIKYNAGSIESLINITEASGGMTIIPELATWNLTPERKERVIPFYEPTPVREISIIHHKFTTKLRLINSLTQIISSVIPSYMKIKDTYQRIDINPI